MGTKQKPLKNPDRRMEIRHWLPLVAYEFCYGVRYLPSVALCWLFAFIHLVGIKDWMMSQQPSVILATASYDHTIKFWEAGSGRCYRTIQYPDSVCIVDSWYVLSIFWLMWFILYFLCVNLVSWSLFHWQFYQL